MRVDTYAGMAQFAEVSSAYASNPSGFSERRTNRILYKGGYAYYDDELQRRAVNGRLTNDEARRSANSPSCRILPGKPQPFS